MMHASIWNFVGDPDDLLRRYESMLSEVPSEAMNLHMCLRAPLEDLPVHSAIVNGARVGGSSALIL
jgi:hypothetical protein